MSHFSIFQSCCSVMKINYYACFEIFANASSFYQKDSVCLKHFYNLFITIEMLRLWQHILYLDPNYKNLMGIKSSTSGFSTVPKCNH